MLCKYQYILLSDTSGKLPEPHPTSPKCEANTALSLNSVLALNLNSVLG